MPFDPSTAKPADSGTGKFDPSTATATAAAPKADAPSDSGGAGALDFISSSGAESVGKGVVGALDVGRAAVTGAGANVMGGLMGAMTIGTNALGLTDDDPVAMIRKWQSLAYPITTETGAKIATGISKGTEAVAKTFGVQDAGPRMGEHFFNLTGSPLEATVAEMMPDVASTILGFKGPQFIKEAAIRGAGEIAKKALFNKSVDAAARAAKQAHLSIAPTGYGNPVMKAIAGMSGKAEVERMHSARNKERVVELAKLNMQIPETAPLDAASYKAARFRASRPYDEGRKMGRMQVDQKFMTDVQRAGSDFQQVASDFPDSDLAKLDQDIKVAKGTYLVSSWDSSSAIDQMSYLREQASDLLRSDKASERVLGKVYRDISTAFEDRMYRHAASPQVNRPDFASSFQRARKELAQIHAWEDATNFSTGQISPRQLVAQRHMVAHRGVDPFSDELKIVADAAEAFPQSFQDVDTKGRYGPISVFERYALAGGALSAVTGAVLGHPGYGAVAATGWVGAGASGAVGRALAGSRMATKRVPSGKPGPIRRAAMGAGKGAQAAGAVAGAEAGNE